MEPFVFTFKSPKHNEFRVIANNKYEYEYNIQWEHLDSGESGSETDVTENYKIPAEKNGMYRVEITGQFPHFKSLSSFFDNDVIQTVEQWGDIEWQSMEQMFQFCTGFTLNASDTPNLENVENMSRMFLGANSFNQPINNWDVSNVENMTGMFYKAESFNNGGKSLDWDNTEMLEGTEYNSLSERFKRWLSSKF